MDKSGKIIWTANTEVQTASLKAMEETEVQDGEPIVLVPKVLHDFFFFLPLKIVNK